MRSLPVCLVCLVRASPRESSRRDEQVKIERAGKVLGVKAPGIDVAQLIEMQDSASSIWHTGSFQAPQGDLPALALRHHRSNFDLWHEEDSARDPAASDADLARVKRAIDCLNQQRNDSVEEIDAWLLRHFPRQNETSPLHSETPGLMLDRLSILSLKIFHTREEINRADAGPDHRSRNNVRLGVLEEQRADLTTCLHTLLEDVGDGRRRFKLYQQMKMYNDPDLNPAVYKSRGG